MKLEIGDGGSLMESFKEFLKPRELKDSFCDVCGDKGDAMIATGRVGEHPQALVLYFNR